MRRVTSALLMSCLGLLAVSAHAADPDDIIKYRKNVMNANGGLMGAANAILLHKVDNKAPLAAYAKALEGTSKDIAALFPKGTNAGDTDALPEVWSKRADFERRAKDTETKAAAFAKSASAGGKDADARFKDLADACKACHKEFRK